MSCDNSERIKLIFQSGRVFDLILLLTLTILSIYFIKKVRENIDFVKINRLPAIDAIEEGIGRAVEMGLPIHFAAGYRELRTDSAVPEKASGYFIMEKIAEMAAKGGAKMYVSERDPLPLAYIKEALKNSYEKGGWPEGFEDDMIIWYPWNAGAYGIPNWIKREHPGASFLMGDMRFTSVIIGEAGALEGTFQIGWKQTEFLIASCDYVLIADEFYATSAYMSKEPSLVGSIAGNDYFKMILIGIFIVSTILFNIGVKDILEWIAL